MKRIIYILLAVAYAAVSCQTIDPVEGLSSSVGYAISATSTVEIFGRAGGEDMITLTVNSPERSWELLQESGKDWCVPSVTSGQTSSSIRLSVTSNNGAPRTSLLVFTAPECENDTLVVNQEGLILEEMPKGMKYGINYDKDSLAVTLVFYDKDLENKYHDYCYLIGDFSGWEPTAEYAMKRDDRKDCWWYTMTDVEPGEEYMFQYYLGNVGEDPIRVSDPYTEIVYLSSDSKIDESTYPDMPSYPEKTNGLVSAFQLDRPSYKWNHSDFSIADEDNLIVYELLIRDFTQQRNLQGVLEKMDYLQGLGINAIELMPVQEFDASLSWGYDPISYFALDKDYGTREMYKKFIDECHARGIAVIFDVVYNHLTGASTFAKMYFRHCRTAITNPWFNQYAPHGFSVFHDIRHDNSFVVNHVKESLKYLLKEYKIDGFRFDLTKGFTQNSGTEGSYDADRIEILKGYYDAIKATNPHAVMICEHLVGGDEEIELGNYGLKMWRNMNDPYCQTAMGYQEGSDLSGAYTDSSGMPFGSLVSYMESHDEVRTCYKLKAYAPESVKNSIEARMKRAALNAAFFLTIPGPKMIWQFGEVGYDYSIQQNEKGNFHESDPSGYRTSTKPIRWDFYDDGVEGEGEDEFRRELYNTYAALLKFRNENPSFFAAGCWVHFFARQNEEWPGKYLYVKDSQSDRWFAVVGNFGTESNGIVLGGPENYTGSNTWYNHFNREETYTTGQTIDMAPAEFKILTNF